MINGKRILAVIPARSGSKRLPGKNIKELAGKPLIQWTIESAINCKEVDEIMVSTDDLSIAKLSQQLGVNVPFIRPDYLSQDDSSSMDVVLHSLAYFSEKGQIFDYVVLLQPTSPLRNAKHISEAIALLVSKNGDAIISVCETEHSPLWSNTLKDDCSMESFLSAKIKNKRSQELPNYYRLNGAIYLVETKRLEKECSFLLSDNTYAYKMDRHSSIDIDEELDFDMAELIMNRYRK